MKRESSHLVEGGKGNLSERILHSHNCLSCVIEYQFMHYLCFTNSDTVLVKERCVFGTKQGNYAIYYLVPRCITRKQRAYLGMFSYLTA